MIPLRLNEAMLHTWKTSGYTHLHYGAVGLALTLHGRKGLPVVERIALLDTRYKEYQHACIATIQTTLNAGIVFVTLFPNFNMALEGPQILQNLQIQLQITGTPQVGNTYAATLHHQMAYRVQNHAMDLSIPRDTDDALFIQPDLHSDEDDYPRKRNRKKKSSQQILKEKYMSGDPSVGLLGEPRGKTFEYYVQYSKPEKLPDSQKDIPTCYMFGPSSSQDINFPPTEFEEDNSRHSWKIKNPVIKNPDGSMKQLENAQVQNNLLQRLDTKMTIMYLAVKEVHQKISSLHQELLKLATTASIASPLLLQKESELNSLKSQLYSLQNPSKTPQDVPYRLVARFYGRLRQWWISLGTYRQLQIRQASTVNTFIGNTHNEFLGAWDHYTTQAREEFLSMKCCSFMRKDLERHYERMSKRFDALGGMDDVNLKQTYLNSLPEPLGNETAGQFSLKSIPLGTATFGQLYQTSLEALEKLRNHQKFFKQLQEQGKLLGRACDHPELSIRCRPEKYGCTSSDGRKNKFYKKRWKRRFPRLSESKKWKFFRRKKQRGFKKSDRCYIYKKKGHYAKDCQNKKKRDNLVGYLAQIEDIEDADIKSIFSLDDGPTDETILAMGVEFEEDSSGDSDQDSEEDDIRDQFVRFDLCPIEICKAGPQDDIPTYPLQPSPNAKIYIFPNKYDKPIPVIAYFDTGAASSIIKPNILPSSHWEACSVAFRAESGHIFYISLKSKPIYIQLFPDNIAKTLCAESHSEFLTKCSSPLWQNPEFFITLPLKKNEDINPTKVSHMGMNPDHYTLAFKKAEQVRGKLRLVINYQPLNHFLTDDKFPLPKREVLFQKLPQAQIF
ncbi:hypothetical protein RND81_07G047500 [Saponaria officinalis]|uniref:Uncharacterized protein n=1 Tax=Saponaria officinalis TaxID=3572 RepID=A0AAW1JQS3_SAPOF